MAPAFRAIGHFDRQRARASMRAMTDLTMPSIDSAGFDTDLAPRDG